MRDVMMISIPASEGLEAAGSDVAWNDVRLCLHFMRAWRHELATATH